MKRYDCIIIGGGPAGLSAGIYMGRFKRSTLIIDAAEGRSSFSQVNENYFGFPEGIPVRELVQRGREQAQRFGVEIIEEYVQSAHRDDYRFFVHTDESDYEARCLILCTGVDDVWPPIPDVLDYVGRSLFWCITCDGFKAEGRRLLLFGTEDEAAVTACQFLRFTDQITFLMLPGASDCTCDKLQDLAGHDVKVEIGTPKEARGTPDNLEGVVLDNGKVIPCDMMFSLLGCRPRNRLAKELGVELDRQGYAIADPEGYTCVTGVFCAGDLSGVHSHQVVSAAHEGAEAAQTANYYLYESYQKNPKDVERELKIDPLYEKAAREEH